MRMSLRERLAWAIAAVMTSATVGLGSWAWRLNRATEALREERDAYYTSWSDAEDELRALRIDIGALPEPEPEPMGPPIG
jgi:hypothetical protein